MPEPTEETGYKIFNNPVSIAKRSNQKVHLVAQAHKAALLAHLFASAGEGQSVVVTKTKRDADTLETYLQDQGIKAAAIHSNRSKAECEATAEAFKSGECPILITTDMILQALGIKELSSIVSYDLPGEPEHYLYRMGCLGEKGQAVALVSPEENSLLYAIERTMKRAIPQEAVPGFKPEPSEESDARPRKHKEKPRYRVEMRKTGPKPRTDRKPRDDNERSDKRGDGEREAYGKKPAEGERKEYAKKGDDRGRKEYDKKSGDRKPYGKKPAEGERKKYAQKGDDRGRKEYDKKSGDRKPYGKKPAEGERKKYAQKGDDRGRKEYDKKSGERKASDNKPAVKKETSPKRPVRRITLEDQKKKASS